MDMAVGVIIGGAFSGSCNSLTDNFINPVLNVLTGGKIYSLEDVAGFASSFLSAVVNFIIMAFILFCLMKAINKLVNLSKPEEKPAAPTTKSVRSVRARSASRQRVALIVHLFWKRMLQKKNKL